MKTINENFKLIVDKLLDKGNRSTNIAHAMGYSTTTQLHKAMSGDSYMTSIALQNLVESYHVNPNFLFTGIGSMFIEEPNNENIGYVLYNTYKKAFMSTDNIFVTSLKEATIYTNEITAESVLYNYMQTYKDSPFSGSLLIRPVKIEIFK